jgi:endoglucanase
MTKPLPIKAIFTFIILIIFGINTLSSQGFLHRNGKYIYDGAGNEVILRGIGTGNWMLQEGYMMQTSGVADTQHEFRAKLIATIGEEKTNQFYDKWLENHFTRADVDSMKSWGFNSVRVAMHYKWFTPPIEDEAVPGEITWIDKGFIMIDSLLKWCEANEMYLILDLHGAPGGQGKDAAISDYDPTKPSLWESQANKDKTIALWRKLAERYSDEPWIGGYDLINETNWTFPEGNNSQLKKLMMDITAAIREVDTNHIIFVEGNGFANDFSGMTPPWDDNMAYSFHKYWSYNTQESINFAINLRNTHNVPIWLGETGENSNVWFTSLIALAEINRIGWAMWPVKKPGINNVLRVVVNSDYTNLINYWKGTAANPGAEAAFNAVMQFAENHRIENCIYQKDVVDAMIRQPHTNETIPYTHFKVGEPVFATDYNLGRSGHAYWDTDSANFHLNTNTFVNWNKGWAYRNDGVDIQECTDTDDNNGFNVGWTETGEWMEYTLDVDSTAGYTLGIRSASGSAGSKVRLEVDGTAVTSIINLPGTSGWQSWRTTEVKEVILEKGVRKVKFIFEQGGSNLNYFKFSDPVSVDSISFNSVLAETDVSGKFINLTLNKPITSHISEVLPSNFVVTINGNPLQVASFSWEDSSPETFTIGLNEPLYYGGNIRLSYNATTLLHKEQQLEVFTNMVVKNNLPVRFTLPMRIEAENYSFNNGMVSETCTDTGGGFNMGYASPGKYLDYFVYVAEAGSYTFNVRVATIRATNELVIRTGEETTFTDAGTLQITATGGWQTWKTVPITVNLPEGRYTLRLFIKSGEFNINWFQVSKATNVSVDPVVAPTLNIYPNPACDYIMIEMPEPGTSPLDIIIYNTIGQAVKHVSSTADDKIKIDMSDLEKGLYIISIRNNHQVISNTKIIVGTH